MWVWVGMELIGSTRDKKVIYNSCVYEVMNITDRSIEVRLARDYWKPAATPEEEEEDVADPRQEPMSTVLTYAEASKYLRPQYALTYASIQGRTLRDKKVAVLDLDSEFVTLRHLMVASSRVTEGRLLACATHGVQRHLVAQADEWEAFEWGRAVMLGEA